MTDYEYKAAQIRQTVVGMFEPLSKRAKQALQQARSQDSSPQQDNTNQIALTEREQIMYRAMNDTAMNLRHQVSSYQVIGSNLIAEQLALHAEELERAMATVREMDS